VSSSVRIDADTREAMAMAENQVFVSSASIWEIATKQAAGRLVFPLKQFEDIARRGGYDMLPILPAHAIAAGALPRHHADPFDRMLIAQAVTENLMLVTSDGIMARYDVHIFDPKSA
jgi:PIN domain nuclease of toxin-antitoxin system